MQGQRTNEVQGGARSRTKGRVRDTPGDVVEAITDLTLRGIGPAEIGRKLTADKRFRGRVPGSRTIKKYVAIARGSRSGASEPWRLADADPADAAIVVPVLVTVIDESLGSVRVISKAEAALIVRIVRAAPDVEAWDAYRLSRRLVDEPGADVDVQTYLSFAPWRGDAERKRYFDAYTHGLIGAVVLRYETDKEALSGHHEEGEAR